MCWRENGDGLILQNGLLSALPFVLQFGTKMIASTSADYLKRHKIFPNTLICKIYNSIGDFRKLNKRNCLVLGTYGAAIGLLLVTFDDCHHYIIAIAFICFSTACSSFYAAGFQTSLVKLKQFVVLSIGEKLL